MVIIDNIENDINELNLNPELNWLSENFRNNIFSEILNDLNVNSKYYDEDSFTAASSNKDFICLSLNACSLPANIEEMVVVLLFT